MLITSAQYAERRGISDRAVRKAIAAGRIRHAVVRVGKSWKIDPDAADQEWDQNTTTAGGVKVPTAGNGQLRRERPSAKALKKKSHAGMDAIENDQVAPKDAPCLTPSGAADPLPPRIPGQAQAAAIRTMYQARLLELELKQKQGQLVPKDDVDRVWFEEIRRARDAFRRLPLQMIGDVAKSVGGMTQEQRADALLVIERHIVGVLEGLSKDAD